MENIILSSQRTIVAKFRKCIHVLFLVITDKKSVLPQGKRTMPGVIGHTRPIPHLRLYPGLNLARLDYTPGILWPRQRGINWTRPV